MDGTESFEEETPTESQVLRVLVDEDTPDAPFPSFHANDHPGSGSNHDKENQQQQQQQQQQQPNHKSDIHDNEIFDRMEERSTIDTPTVTPIGVINSLGDGPDGSAAFAAPAARRATVESPLGDPHSKFSIPTVPIVATEAPPNTVTEPVPVEAGGSVSGAPAASPTTLETGTGLPRRTSPPDRIRPPPTKRARSAYFLFMEEQRAQVQQQHAGGSVATVAKVLGQLWNALPPQDKARYQQMAALEKEHYQQAMSTNAMERIANDHNNNNNATNGTTNTRTVPPDHLILPAARIRKICKLDPDVKGLSKEAVLLICKAGELATRKLGEECVKTAALQNRRKLLPDDLAQVCSTREAFTFLREDVADLLVVQQQQQQRQLQNDTSATGIAGASNGGEGKAPNLAQQQAVANTKPLTSYFAPKHQAT